MKRGAFVCIGARKSYTEARDLVVVGAVRVLRDLTGVTEGEAVLYGKTVGSLRDGAVLLRRESP